MRRHASLELVLLNGPPLSFFTKAPAWESSELLQSVVETLNRWTYHKRIIDLRTSKDLRITL